MVFRLGALATDADVEEATAAAQRLKKLLLRVGAAARALEAEPQAVYAYLVRHMQTQQAAAAEAAALSASWAGGKLRAAASPQQAPPAWHACDAALGGADAAAALGADVGELRRVVRVKVQDNNDLALAARVVADACAFFGALAAHAAEEGARGPAAALKALRA